MIPLSFLLLLGSVFIVSHDARAADCMVECFDRGAEGRKSQLLCEVACERRDPKNVSYCPEYTPCILGCEIQFPEELVKDQATKNEKIKCMGACMTKYFKLGCEEPPPDHPGGGGGGGGPGAVRRGSGNSHEAPKTGIVSAPRAVPQNQIGETNSAAPEPAETEASKAGAVVSDPTPGNSGRDTVSRPAAAPSSYSSVAPVTGLMESILAEETELTLFLRVGRKYREKEKFLISGAGKPE